MTTAMQFDKPKVTIDLEEYQYLKEKSENIDLDKMTIVAKKIFYWCGVAMASGRANVIDVKAQLAKEGIMIFQRPNSTVEDSWAAIDFKFENK